MLCSSSLKTLRCLGGRLSVRPRSLSAWTQRVSESSSKVQLYISKTDDPYLNLSIEHFLLERSPPDSAVLFLYVNRPCIVIGRNQNPWLEVNLNILDTISRDVSLPTEPPALGRVELVRRRSGGGAVFHDEGNVNWTVICPSAEFTRDKHAEMIVRALRQNGIERARVNERHDIVLDQGSVRNSSDASDFHRTPFTENDARGERRPVKVSGSAYKLTRGRALHHGTCLLSSPNLQIIPHYLHSPAKPYIKAKGVESVSSPVGNIGLGNGVFIEAVRRQFAQMYRPRGNADIEEEVGDETLQEPTIKNLWDEMQTPEWTLSQTPQFIFSSHPTNEDDRQRPALPSGMPVSTRIHMAFKHGQVIEATLSVSPDTKSAQEEARTFLRAANNCRLSDNEWTWKQMLDEVKVDVTLRESLSAWLQAMLPIGLPHSRP